MTYNRLACFVLGFGLAVLFTGGQQQGQQGSAATALAGPSVSHYATGLHTHP